ncbi:hypothetical protein B0J11DRAFT_16424 [Dendryphion nanum]|uniref:Uncharacterized protein n=1 Tax=Dendryphion nanum TaxID=256645 RepID=A0A9P9J034_9PLEO|nr:hypothetical protein B0J11DRAFT_16424 [Dendryphion nanum]
MYRSVSRIGPRLFVFLGIPGSGLPLSADVNPPQTSGQLPTLACGTYPLQPLQPPGHRDSRYMTCSHAHDAHDAGTHSPKLQTITIPPPIAPLPPPKHFPIDRCCSVHRTNRACIGSSRLYARQEKPSSAGPVPVLSHSRLIETGPTSRCRHCSHGRHGGPRLPPSQKPLPAGVER